MYYTASAPADRRNHRHDVAGLERHRLVHTRVHLVDGQHKGPANLIELRVLQMGRGGWRGGVSGKCSGGGAGAETAQEAAVTKRSP